MRTRDQFIHEQSATKIYDIINNQAWETSNQSISSAITNQDNILAPSDHYVEIGENTSGPTAFVDIQFDRSVKRVIDIGGGKFDCNKDYLKLSRNIELHIWDPFNRSAAHNLAVKSEFLHKKADAVTSMSVLNVIQEVESRLAHIATLKDALANDGKAYIKIWPGELPYKGSYTPTSTNSYYQANAYADRFLSEIEVVFGKGNVHLSSKVENLIVAEKKPDQVSTIADIEAVQLISRHEALGREREKSKAIKKIQARDIQLMHFNMGLFKQVGTDTGFAYRHQDHFTQREYDKRFGLVKK